MDKYIFLELSIKGLNILNALDYYVEPVTLAYTNKTWNQIIDPMPTRFLCKFAYTRMDSPSTALLEVFKSAVTRLDPCDYKL